MQGVANHFYIMCKLINWSQLPVWKMMKNTKGSSNYTKKSLRAAFHNSGFVLVNLAFKEQLQAFLTLSLTEFPEPKQA